MFARIVRRWFTKVVLAWSTNVQQRVPSSFQVITRNKIEIKLDIRKHLCEKIPKLYIFNFATFAEEQALIRQISWWENILFVTSFCLILLRIFLPKYTLHRAKGRNFEACARSEAR